MAREFICEDCGAHVASFDSGFYAFGNEPHRGLCLVCTFIRTAPEADRPKLRELLRTVTPR